MSTKSITPTVDLITIDSETYFEVKVKDPHGEGFLVEHVSPDDLSGHEEIEAEIEAAKDRLQQRLKEKKNADSDELSDELKAIADEY